MKAMAAFTFTRMEFLNLGTMGLQIAVRRASSSGTIDRLPEEM
jgi:hypothetical protein